MTDLMMTGKNWEDSLDFPAIIPSLLDAPLMSNLIL